MNKTAIKNFAVWARQKLIKDISYKASLLGVSENGIAEALPQSTNDLKFFDIGTKDYAEVSGKEIKQREALVSAIKTKERDTKDYKEAYEFVIEEVAYTWFNRLIAIRFMEVNDYLPSGIRVLSSENQGKNEPDFVTNPFDADLDLTSYEQDKVIELKDQNKSNELFRMLFIKQCNKLHEILPRLFEKTDDYSELLLNISFTDKDDVVYRLVHDIDEDDFNVEKEGQVEIIGWMYQYYNIEPKAVVFARAKGKKIKKEQIPAVTQLFTPDWIVRYMVENSLGRLWYEGHNDTSIKDNWKYYIDEAEQESEVQVKLNAIKEEYKAIKPEEIKLIDPCMGSGHILVYAFDVLMQIYENYGYTQRDAASLIVENNIYGLDIDERAAQLAYFAVMMKGRQYDRRFFARNLTPHIYDVPDIERVHNDTINAFSECANIARRVCDSFIDGKEFGSLITPNVSLVEIEKLNNKLEDMKSNATDIFGQLAISTVIPLMDIVTMLVQKYDVVITNPPYMAVSSAGEKLNDYVKKYYLDSKTDMFAVFMEHCETMIKKNRFQAMITMHSWMFLSSFEKLREKLLLSDTINMAHLGARAFEEISGEVVQTTAFVFRNSLSQGYKSTYCRLIEPTTQQGKEDMFLAKDNRYISEQSNFSKIPGSPIAYWVSEQFIQVFEKDLLKSKVEAVKGLDTCDNDRFTRFWSEVLFDNISFATKDAKETYSHKWYPYCKGGGYGKWYGFMEKVVEWENDGAVLRNLRGNNGKIKSRPQNIRYYFKEGATWSTITSNKLSLRYMNNSIFGGGGSGMFCSKDLFYYLGFLNSIVTEYSLKALNPTLNFLVGDILSLPVIENTINKAIIESLVKDNIELSKNDWDSFETSWDFEKHPLVRSVSLVSDAFNQWNNECEERFIQLKANEEELNRIFIDIYGLQDELTPDVEDKDVTVRKADLQRDIKSLISYAVGCMFGRYSPLKDGLIYAGGEWDYQKISDDLYDAIGKNDFTTRNFYFDANFIDSDNVIPVTDEEYFKDDIVHKFVNFMEMVYGRDTLEDNLDFIANALDNKGKTSREIIRNYFLTDFIKDHIRIYQKRPIYWLFDSGKQNGFKALVYMHRWNADTIGNMRVEYLHRMQRVYDKEIERMQETIDNSHDNKEVNAAVKRKEKLQKQLKETKDYDAKVAHLALSRIDIDLDDGVKVNYDKVQTPPDGKKMQILAKI